MSETDGIAAVILNALAHGFDVEMRIKRRDDGKQGADWQCVTF